MTPTQAQGTDGYEMLDSLATSRMREVCGARDLVLQRGVALKAFPSCVLKVSERQSNSEQTVQVTPVVNHPNVLAAHRLVTFEDAQYLVADLLLRDVIETRAPRGKVSNDDLSRHYTAEYDWRWRWR